MIAQVRRHGLAEFWNTIGMFCVNVANFIVAASLIVSVALAGWITIFFGLWMASTIARLLR